MFFVCIYDYYYYLNLISLLLFIIIAFFLAAALFLIRINVVKRDIIIRLGVLNGFSSNVLEFNNLLAKDVKELRHRVSHLRRGLKVNGAYFLSVALGLRQDVCGLLLLGERVVKVLFRPHDSQHSLLREVFVQLLGPRAHLLEGLGHRHVEDKQRARSAVVVHGGERAEALLAGGIPDLKFERYVVHNKTFGEKACTDCGLCTLVEYVADVTQCNG